MHYAVGKKKWIEEKRGIRQDIENENVWVLEHDGKVIGTGSLGENRIERLYVLPAFNCLL